MTLKSSNAWIKGIVTATALVAMSACAAGEGTADNPVLRKFQWFSYLEGGDFKQACTTGSAGRYRMVYNGIYTEQVRVYDLHGDSGVLDARLIEAMDVADFAVEGWSDLLNPWRGTKASRTLDTAETARIVSMLADDGMFDTPAVGTELPSMGFFWTIAACHEGVYHFTGLAWPSPAWDQARFDDALFAVDPIDAAVNEPRKTTLTRDRHSGLRYDTVNEFIVKVGADGLAGF